MTDSALSEDEILEQMKSLDSNWQIKKNKIIREMNFPTFAKNVDFMNKVAMLAEKENHHPSLNMNYKQLVIEIWTHSIDGLLDKDFQLARDIDDLEA